MSELIRLVARFVLSLFAVVLGSLSAATAEVPLAVRPLLSSRFGAMTAEESQREIPVVGQVDVAGVAAALRVAQDAARG